MDLDVGLGETVMVDGQVVEVDALRIAEAIKEYDPNLSVVCLDPATAGINDAPFLIVEQCADGVTRRVFEAWVLDQRVLDRIRMADKFQGNDAEARYDAIMRGIKRDKEQRYQEQREANKDWMETVVKIAHGQSSVTLFDHRGDLIKINEQGPVERNNGRKHYHLQS